MFNLLETSGMKYRIIILSIVLGTFVSFAIAQSADQNYIHSWVVQVPNQKTAADLNFGTSTSIALQTIQYFDGLGRPIQVVQKGYSPQGGDLIKPIIYNGVGLDEINYEPYVGNTPTGLYRSDFKTPQEEFYNTTMGFGDKFAYSPVEYEKSPLNRILKQGSPGEDWQIVNGIHYKSISNLSNNNTDAELTVVKWIVTNNTCTRDNTYSDNSLYVTRVIGEDGEVNYEFKDKQGQVILKRSILGVGTLVDTYYVYDDFGLLRFVISPEGIANVPNSFDATNSIAIKYVYFYKYDARKRLIEKRIPGKATECYVYDKRDKIILYQDGNLQAKETQSGKFDWVFTKYDALGRVIMTGIMYIDKSKTRSILQDEANTTTRPCWEIIDYTGQMPNTSNIYYSNNSYPLMVTTQYKVLTINYYDTYRVYTSSTGNPTLICPATELLLTGTSGSTPVVEPYSSQVHGFSTVTFVGSDQYDYMLPSLTYYDKYGRVTRTSSNHHLTTNATAPRTGYDLHITEYKGLTNNVSNLKHWHYAKKSITTPFNYLYSFTEESKYTFDHAGRQTDYEYIINGSTVKQFTHNVYDQLGRLKTKQIKEGTTELQLIDYYYNIKGWLTGINNPATVSGTTDLFGMEILYNTQKYSMNNEEQYNGNISAIIWQTAQPTGLATPQTTGMKAYKYVYDKLNRLLEGRFSEIFNSTTTNSNTYSEVIITNSNPYDLNGNIRTMNRYGKKLPNNTDGLIDQLTYYYDGNQLIGVNDMISNSNSGDFIDGGNTAIPNPSVKSTWEYNYDNNGNLIADKNKGLFGFVYNTFNMPISIQKLDGWRTEYIYDATGIKRRQNLYFGINSISKTTDFIGNIVYENGIPAYVNYNEGRIVINTNGTWFAESYLKDHLGNIRVAFQLDNGVVKTRQVNSYYPFGMNIKGLSQNSTDTYKPNEYLYNGKMMQDEMGLNWLDYGARFYDPVLGRWHSVDPLAEKYRYMSPYNYVGNNPIRAIDFDGRDIIVLNNPKGGSTYGHMAVLIGNDKNGWTFISKEGRDKPSWYSKTYVAEFIGGPALQPLIGKFDTKAAFDEERRKKGSGYKVYTQEVRLETSEEQDKAAISATEESAKSWYNFMFSNCADAVSDGLIAAGLDPGYTTVGTSIDDNPFSAGKDMKTLNPRPTERFKQIVKNNKDHEAKDENETNQAERNSQTWIQTINTWLQQNPNITVTYR